MSAQVGSSAEPPGSDGDKPHAQLHPQTCLVHLESIDATSSAFPETFGLALSYKGDWVLAYSSAALYLILAHQLPLMHGSCRAFRLKRRPIAAAISDSGRFAVLSNAHTANVYQCGDGTTITSSTPARKIRTFLLHSEVNSIAFAPNGQMIVIGSPSGIDIIVLDLPEGSDRRHINCGFVDAVVFSHDAKSLLITSPARQGKATTFLTISTGFDDFEDVDDVMLHDPDQDEALLPQEHITTRWLSQLLFPDHLSARQSSFLPDHADSHAGELLAYSATHDRFAIFDTALKTFTGKILTTPHHVAWSTYDRFDDALPAVSDDGVHLATAVHLKDHAEVWVYRASPDWRDSSSEESSLSLAPLLRLALPASNDVPPGSITFLKWLNLPDSSMIRLLALANTIPHAMPDSPESLAAPGVSAKIFLFDLPDVAAAPPLPDKVVLDLDQIPLVDLLVEEELELEQQVVLARQRTHIQRIRQEQVSNQLHVDTTLPTTASCSDIHSDPLPHRRSPCISPDTLENMQISPGMAVDEPYSQSAPRPQFMLSRAATAALNSPSTRTHLRALPTAPLDYRRRDGLQEMPHESDADNWIPPPPPYSEEVDAPGPYARSLPISAIPGLADRVLQGLHVQNNQCPNGMQARVLHVIPSPQIPAPPLPLSLSSAPASHLPPPSCMTVLTDTRASPSYALRPSTTTRMSRGLPLIDHPTNARYDPPNSNFYLANTQQIPASTLSLPGTVPSNQFQPSVITQRPQTRGITQSYHSARSIPQPASYPVASFAIDDLPRPILTPHSRPLGSTSTLLHPSLTSTHPYSPSLRSSYDGSPSSLSSSRRRRPGQHDLAAGSGPCSLSNMNTITSPFRPQTLSRESERRPANISPSGFRQNNPIRSSSSPTTQSEKSAKCVVQ